MATTASEDFFTRTPAGIAGGTTSIIDPGQRVYGEVLAQHLLIDESVYLEMTEWR
jgi:dihydroorotase-like cyclic amidohydrolase